MPKLHAVTTVEELLALPDDGLRHELLDGEHVVTPAPTAPHQRALRELMIALQGVLEDSDVFNWYTSPADIRLAVRTLVQPDLFVVTESRRRPLKRWEDAGVPVLAIEVLSPSTAPRDRGKKRRIYQEAGVPEYWIVDLDARLIERWRPSDARPEIVTDELCWQPEPSSPTLAISIPRLFTAIHGEA